MSFQPVVPFGGYSGWAFLNRTKETQQAAFNGSQDMKRDVEYFSEKIGAINSAEDLVKDRRLLKVALGAFGLDEDIGNKFFIQKVLEDGSLDEDALANKLSDKRYLEFTKAFGFGDFDVPRTVLSDFAQDITSTYLERQFEIAVGEQNSDMRLAMAVESQLTDIASNSMSNDGKWFTIMGNAPLRSVFETAFSLPSSFGALDIDKQLKVFKERAESMLGTSDVSQFVNADARTDLVRNFLVRSEINQGASVFTSASVALSLLQS